LKKLRKTVSAKAEVTSGGGPHQTQIPATGNARSPTADIHYTQATTHHPGQLSLASLWGR